MEVSENHEGCEEAEVLENEVGIGTDGDMEATRRNVREKRVGKRQSALLGLLIGRERTVHSERG